MLFTKEPNSTKETQTAEREDLKRTGSPDGRTMAVVSLRSGTESRLYCCAKSNVPQGTFHTDAFQQSPREATSDLKCFAAQVFGPSVLKSITNLLFTDSQGTFQLKPKLQSKRVLGNND